jgi:hypothetical protein
MTWDGGEHAQRLSLPPAARRFSVVPTEGPYLTRCRRNGTSQTHGYRGFVRVAASAGRAIAELHGVGLAAARAEALGHI